MIDKEKTKELFGYYPDDLILTSSKKVVVVCDKCGDSNIIQMQSYHRAKHTGLCLSCAKTGKMCGDENHFFGKHHSDETRKKLRAQKIGKTPPNLGKHHSDETREKMVIAARSRWGARYGTSDENLHFYNSPEYQRWRTSVFDRDNFTCQNCGDSSGGNLNAHHILPYRDWREPQYSLNPSNGITLCKRCHRETYGCEYDSFSKYFDLVHGITQLTLTR